MSIHIEQDPDRPALRITIWDLADINAFKTLIQRGAQTWADAPASIKEAADLITSGKIMQDYRTLPGNPL